MGELRVLLVSPNREAAPELIPPLAAAHLSGALRRAGIDCRLVDFMLEPAPESALRDTLEDYDPDVVGLSIRNIDNSSYPLAVSFIPEVARTAEILSEHGAPVVVGGAGAAISPMRLLDRIGLDILVRGEGERTFPTVVRALAEGSDVGAIPGLVIRTREGPRFTAAPAPIRGEELPGPDYSIIDLDSYVARGGVLGVQTKRGCPFHCAYCVYPGIEGVGIRCLPPERISAEVTRLRGDFNIERIFLVDSVFNNPSSHAVAVARALGEARTGVRYGCYVSPRDFSPELADALVESGCEGVEFGTDSLSEPVLASLRKPFGVADVRAAAAACREAGLPQCHHLIFGAPGETPDTVEETIGRMEDIEPDAVIGMSGLRVYEGTTLADQVISGSGDPLDLLEPVHYIDAAVAGVLSDRLLEHVNSHPGWVLPGLGHNCDARLFERIRETGYRGPPWALLRRMAT